MAMPRFIGELLGLIATHVASSTRAWTAPWMFRISLWVLAWVLASTILSMGAARWGAAVPPASARVVLTTFQGSGYDAERCARTSDTWRAAELAVENFRLTKLVEYQSDAERLRNQAREEGRLYCSGDPSDR